MLGAPIKKPMTIRPRARKSAWENALRACPIEPWHGQNLTLRIRPEAFRFVMSRRWDSIQHDCHHALLFKKTQLQLNKLATYIKK